MDTPALKTQPDPPIYFRRIIRVAFEKQGELGYPRAFVFRVQTANTAAASPVI
jgi:hypothetical protein